MKRRPPRRFAEATKVPIGKTKAEIEELLRKHGAKQTLSGTDTESGNLLCGFTMDGRQVRMTAVTSNGKGSAEQRERQAWRALLLLVKGKLEIIAMGYTTFENEFLANLVLPNGQTVADDVVPKIAKAYESGKMPNLLPSGER